MPRDRIYLSRPENFLGHQVHVDGWNPACFFTLVGAGSNGYATLKTTKGKICGTTNRLWLARSEQD